MDLYEVVHDEDGFKEQLTKAHLETARKAMAAQLAKGKFSL